MRYGQLRTHDGRVRLGRISRSALLVSHDSLRVVLYVRVQLSRPHVGDSERSGAEAGLVPWYAYARSLTHSLTHAHTQISCMSPPSVCGTCLWPTHSPRAWPAVALVGTFNCMDFLGRWVLRWEVLVWKKPELLWVSEWSVVQ